MTLDARLAWSPRKNLEFAIVGQNLLDDRHPEFSPTFIGTQKTEVEKKCLWHGGMALLKTLTRLARKHRFRAWLFIPVILFLGAAKLCSETAASPEYQIKAVFLFNFAQFVEWPPKAFPDPQTPVVIGVLGEDPFGAYLDETLRGEKTNGRPLVVQRYRRASEIKVCHVLFISRSEEGRLEQILASLKGRNVLTVADSNDFAARGGMVQFFTDKKVRMRINLEAAKAANLKISSKLLRVAETVP